MSNTDVESSVYLRPAGKLGFDEIPGPESLKGRWQRAYARYCYLHKGLAGGNASVGSDGSACHAFFRLDGRGDGRGVAPRRHPFSTFLR